MERLTKKRIDDGEAYLACVELRENECDGICTTCWRAGEAVDKLAAYEDTGFSPEAIKSVFTTDALINLAAQALETTPERLRELAAADKDGRVAVLPCKVGDTVYFVNAKQILEFAVVGYAVDETGISWVHSEHVDKTGNTNERTFSPDRFGKNTFLSREEAEKVLQEMEGKE